MNLKQALLIQEVRAVEAAPKSFSTLRAQIAAKALASRRKFWTCVQLVFRLATLRKSVRLFWFCKFALTCVDLRVRLAMAEITWIELTTR